MTQEPHEFTPPARSREKAELAAMSHSPIVLQSLSRDASPAVRKALAANPATPPDVLVALAQDERRNTRRAVAENPSAPEEALLLLVNDAYDEVRWAVPLHGNCGPPVQRAVAASDDSMARQNLAGRPLADDVVATLATDPDPEVRGRVAALTRDPTLLAQLLTDASDLVRMGAAENSSLNPDQILNLAKDRSRRVRAQLAWFQEDLPLEVRALLASERSVDVRYVLTMTRQPESIAEILRNDPHPDVANNMDQWSRRNKR